MFIWVIKKIFILDTHFRVQIVNCFFYIVLFFEMKIVTNSVHGKKTYATGHMDRLHRNAAGPQQMHSKKLLSADRQNCLIFNNLLY